MLKIFWRQKPSLDHFDSLTIFSTAYLLMVLFENGIVGLEEWGYNGPRQGVGWKWGGGGVFIMKELFCFFEIPKHIKVSLVSLPSVRDILFAQEDWSVWGPF